MNTSHIYLTKALRSPIFGSGRQIVGAALIASFALLFCHLALLP